MYAILLAPKYIINSISKELRNFLWQGGKTQGKKSNLINWDKVMEDKTKGGLGIKDPCMMNLAMGAKLVSIFIAGEREWWKEVLREKCIKNPRSKCIDSTWISKGTSIWNLCKKFVGLIKDNIYWISGNDRKINK